jgi:hypothetical protein
LPAPGVVIWAWASASSLATGNAGRRMQQQRLTDGLTFGVERLLYAQRAEVAVFVQHRALAPAGEAEMQVGMPDR